MKYAALFVRSDSIYHTRPGCDAYDIERDATTFIGGCPVVAHPPCRAWGMLSHMANPRPGEKELALFAIGKIRACGGILEHPAGSRVFKKHLPDANSFSDECGGYTIEIDQFDFGHVAHKPTKLYICGVEKRDLPPLPPKRTDYTDRSICGNVKGTKRCTQYQREYTPLALVEWIESVLRRVDR